MGKVLILRTCKPDGTSYGGFQWPESGPVECPDWLPTKDCGNGLHGWLWGEGDGEHGNWEADAKWLVAEVDQDSLVDLDGKVKFPAANVVFCGTRFDATEFLRANGGQRKAVVGDTVSVGHRGTATVGYGGVATSGDYGVSISGNRGTSTSGYGGTSTCGYSGTSTSGCAGTSTSGDNGIIQIKSWDSAESRYRINTAYVGEDGILPDVPYEFINGKFVAV